MPTGPKKRSREAATLTATQALEQNVIEFIATDRDELLQLLDGYEVEIDGETRVLSTAGATVEVYEANWRIKLLGIVSNPEIVLLLGLIGVYGLMYEGWNPGAIVPGVVGVICLLLAAYALQVIPVNYAGLALIFIGIALMVAEAFAPSFGALGIGGVAAFVFGSVMMFDSGIPGFGISLTFVISLALVFALLIVWMLGYLMKLRRRGAVSGRESIIGGIGDGAGRLFRRRKSLARGRIVAGPLQSTHFERPGSYRARYGRTYRRDRARRFDREYRRPATNLKRNL